MGRVSISDISVRLLRVMLLRIISILLLVLLLVVGIVVSLSLPIVVRPRNWGRSHSIVGVVVLRSWILHTIIVMSRSHISRWLLLPRCRHCPTPPWPSWCLHGRITRYISGVTSVVSFDPRVVLVLAFDGACAPRRWGTSRAAVPGLDVIRLVVGRTSNEFLLAGSSDSTLWSCVTSNLEHKLLNQNVFISTRINQQNNS